MQTFPPSKGISGAQYLIPLHMPDWCGITGSGVPAGHPAWLLAFPLEGNRSEEEEEGEPLSLPPTVREHTSVKFWVNDLRRKSWKSLLERLAKGQSGCLSYNE